MKKYSLIFIFIFSILSIYSQNREIDSLKVIVIKEKNDSLRALAYCKLGQKFLYTHPDSCIYYTNISKSIAIKKNIKSIFSYCYNNYGVLHSLKGNYANCLTNYFEGLKYVKPGTIIEGILFNNIGMIYAELKDDKKALEYYRKALSVKKIIGDSSRLASTYINIGNCNNDLNRYDDAKCYFDTALILAQKFDNQVTMADAFGNIGNYYFRKKNFKEAEKNCRKALQVKQSIDDLYGYATSLSDLSLMLMANGNNNEAENVLKEADKIATDNMFIDLLFPIYRNFSDLYKARSDYKNALFYLSKLMTIKDTILADGKLREAAIKENQYSFEMIQLKDSLNNVNKTKETKLLHDKEMFKQRVYTYGGIIAFVCMLLVSIFIFKAYKAKNQSHVIITQQKQEVELKNRIIEIKHKEITDSINYAERIQRSLLASKKMLDENLKDYFVLFKPKDIVSGDFYWTTILSNSNFVIVTADSTGHGVPGAIMSIVNIASLKEAIVQGIQSPDLILNETRRLVIENLKNDGSEEGGKDGMDASLICIDFKNNKMTCACANNPIWIVREGELIEIKSDRMPIGKHDKDATPFKLHSFDLQKGDVIYTLTDGYPDQFGGINGKKFKAKQLQEILVSMTNEPMEIQKQKLEKGFDKWKGNLEQVDDVCVIGIRV